MLTDLRIPVVINYYCCVLVITKIEAPYEVELLDDEYCSSNHANGDYKLSNYQHLS